MQLGTLTTPLVFKRISTKALPYYPPYLSLRVHRFADMQTQLLMVAIVIACAVSYTEGQLPVPTLLNTTITRTECDKSKVCVSSPSTCDPAGNTTCVFASSKLNTTFFFELSGQTSGYVALGLATNQTQGPSTVFVCANNNNSFFFQIASYTNVTAGLTPVNTSSVISVQGAVSGNQSIVQCTFNTATNLAAVDQQQTRSATNNSFYITLYTGNITNGSQLGVPTLRYNSTTPLNMAYPTNNTVANQTTTSSTASPTTATNSTSNSTAISVTSTTGNSAVSSATYGLGVLLSAVTLHLLY